MYQLAQVGAVIAIENFAFQQLQMLLKVITLIRTGSVYVLVCICFHMSLFLMCHCVSAGLLHIVKLPQLNALASADINTADLAFKIRRKRFTIEVFVHVHTSRLVLCVVYW